MKRTAFITSILTSLACMWGSVSQLQAAEYTIDDSYTGTTMLTVSYTTNNGTIKADSNTVTVSNYTMGNYIMAAHSTDTCHLFEGNLLTIRDSNLSNVWGVNHNESSKINTALKKNNVEIYDSTFSGTVVGVFTAVSSEGASATYNKVTIEDSPSWIAASPRLK